jgi:hypothetical protein
MVRELGKMAGVLVSDQLEAELPADQRGGIVAIVTLPLSGSRMRST